MNQNQATVLAARILARYEIQLTVEEPSRFMGNHRIVARPANGRPHKTWLVRAHGDTWTEAVVQLASKFQDDPDERVRKHCREVLEDFGPQLKHKLSSGIVTGRGPIHVGADRFPERNTL